MFTKHSSSIFLGVFLLIFINKSTCDKRTFTFVEFNDLNIKDNTHYSLIRTNSHKRMRRDLNQIESIEALIDPFIEIFKSSEVPDFPEKISDDQISKNKSITTQNPTYYNVTLVNNQPAITDQYWIDMKQVKGSDRHKVQDEASPFKLKFKFRFCGYKFKFITIATGGFLFLGHSRSIPRTQYIAPLMAYYNTSIHKDSNIYYYDNKTSFTVQWDNVYLQEMTVNSTAVDADGEQIRNTIEKPFSFQATLKENGDIIFVYKQIPFLISRLNENKEEHYPIKVGIGDACIFGNQVYSIDCRTITYGYYKTEWNNEEITNGTVIYFKALPTCNSFSDCQSCVSKLLSGFRCSWCSASQKCSDGSNDYKPEFTRKGCVNAVTTCPKNGNDQASNKEDHLSNGNSSINKSGAKPMIPSNDINSSSSGDLSESIAALIVRYPILLKWIFELR